MPVGPSVRKVRKQTSWLRQLRKSLVDVQIAFDGLLTTSIYIRLAHIRGSLLVRYCSVEPTPNHVPRLYIPCVIIVDRGIRAQNGI